MTLRDMMADDVTNIILNVNEFAETVTYVPHRFFGEDARASRSIVAVVERDPIGSVVESESQVMSVYRVSVKNDSTSGIASDEIDTGGDYIELPPRDGKDAERATITRILEQDPAMIVVECRGG
jgi:hypothetical protein